MWPWEHAAVGYLVYSMLCRAVGSRPTEWPALAVLFGTQFPDLIDKPLGWVVGILPSGQSFAHSLLVAVPLSLLLVAVGRWLDRRESGRDNRRTVTAAFSVGYLSHLPGDVLYSALLGGELNTDFLSTPTGGLYLVGELAMMLVAILVWRADGYPGLVWSTE